MRHNDNIFVPSILNFVDVLAIELSKMYSLEISSVINTLHIKTPSSSLLITGAILNTEW